MTPLDKYLEEVRARGYSMLSSQDLPKLLRIIEVLRERIFPCTGKFDPNCKDCVLTKKLNEIAEGKE